MTTPAKAKEALELSFVEYKRCKSRVQKALDSPAPNERTINNKMQQLSDALSQLNIHHTMWVNKAGFTVEQLAAERFSTTWLESEWGDVDDLQDQVDDLASQNLPPTLSQADSIKITLSQIDTLKHDVSTKLTQLLHKTDSSAENHVELNATSVTAYLDITLSV